MTLRLTIDRRRWLDHVTAVRSTIDAAGQLVPVVKGNGYGFGRAQLASEASAWSDLLAMGTAHEAMQHERQGNEQVMVLTPLVRPVALPSWVIPVVGGPHHLPAIADHEGAVAVKLASSMARYGCERDGVADLGAAVRAGGAHGRTIHSFVLHLPLTSDRRDDAMQLAEIEAWLPSLDPDVPLSVSHLSTPSFAALAQKHPRRRFQMRAGTALWHGDKSFLHLTADVVDVRPIARGALVGYRQHPAPDDGWVVMVGAGSSHGVTPLNDGRSPFHHLRHRLVMLEGPHMHTSMCFVPLGEPVPSVGEWVDVQRPLIAVAADELVWTSPDVGS